MSKNIFIVTDDARFSITGLVTEPFGTNAYLLIDKVEGESILIDAPGKVDLIVEKLAETAVKFILLTHGHGDHTPVLEELHERLAAPVACHTGDAAMMPVEPDLLLEDGEKIFCGRRELQVLHTPGHTEGGLCFLSSGYLFSGDTLFPGGPGKTSTPEHFKKILSSIEEKLLPLPDETVILPGHGEPTEMCIEREKIEIFKRHYRGEDLSGDITWL
ncbi:MAG: MBL fold metallo-hydrolase [Bacillota bacterium]|nr:MBL fold metallo-hydrolase [Bacillota bacterium]